MDICNIKFHCEIKKKQLKLFVDKFRNKGLKKYPSFEVFKVKKYSYVCYYTGFINVTGLKKIKHIKASLDTLKKFLKNGEFKFENIVIDNITTKCTCLQEKKICLQKMRNNIQLKYGLDTIKWIKYEREVFPNMFIKTKYSTLIWSTNNKVTCVGINNVKLFKDICSLVNELAIQE